VTLTEPAMMYFTRNCNTPAPTLPHFSYCLRSCAHTPHASWATLKLHHATWRRGSLRRSYTSSAIW